VLNTKKQYGIGNRTKGVYTPPVPQDSKLLQQNKILEEIQDTEDKFWTLISPPEHNKQLLYFRIEYCLMITVPTYKSHKSPFKHSKTICVFTSLSKFIVEKMDHCKMDH
jgi:hypothetical protein